MVAIAALPNVPSSQINEFDRQTLQQPEVVTGRTDQQSEVVAVQVQPRRPGFLAVLLRSLSVWTV